MPGIKIAQGTAIGAMSLVLKSTKPWSINVGVPAIYIKERDTGLKIMEKEFLNENTI